MHKLMEYICEELEELERKADKEGKLSMGEIEYIDKLAHIKKSLLSAEEMWEDSEYSMAMGGSYASGGGGSNAGGGSYARGSYAGGQGGGQSNRGGSYARGGRRGGGRRGGGNQYGSYAMGGYSRAEDFRTELEELIEDAPNEHIKQKMRELMREM